MLHTLLAASLAFVPGDCILAVNHNAIWTYVALIDEGERIEAFGIGSAGLSVFNEARRLVADAPAVPGQVTPLEACRQAAIDTCGQGKVCYIKVVVFPVGGSSCDFGCQDGHGDCQPAPATTTPANPTSPPRPPTPTDPHDP